MLPILDIIGFIVLAAVVLAGAKWIKDNVSININNKKRKG